MRDIVERAERVVKLATIGLDTCEVIKDCVAEITKLRAERAAAARDMRERCAKVAESGDRQTEWPRVEGAQRRSPTANIQTAIATAIRALPAVIATQHEGGE